MRLKDKVAIITGAGNGQGLAEANLFLDEGAKVVATDINLENLKALEKEYKGNLIVLNHDISKENDWENVISKTVEQFGSIDILVNNAGVPSRASVQDETLQGWELVMDVNSTGTFLGINKCSKIMIKQRSGSIVNISSVYGIIGEKGYASYHASKGAIRSLTKASALDLAEYGIRVNSVHPGMIETEMTRDLFENEEKSVWMKDITPLPALGKPKDVAYGVLYLASDEAKFVTGSELVIDGGWIAK
ncbi:SDR family NAD(P)-dependent oxidoreductase [Psychrobacillus sp. FSL K6-1464]|uniref:SDR family NAD(P)-dependent oxidoreductase n=1 Tax=Psychrobacillus sp. FSL K6-1464 TaxID=2921545 RepID=UPI0030F68EF0